MKPQLTFPTYSSEEGERFHKQEIPCKLFAGRQFPFMERGKGGLETSKKWSCSP